MHKLSPMRLGIAFGITGALFYVACILFMTTVPRESVIWLSNSVLHGIDILSIMRDGIPLGQSLAGIGITAMGCFMFGSVSACLYNVGLNVSGSVDGKSA